MQRICAKCGSENIHRSRIRKGEQTLSTILLRPLHCHDCKARYWVPYRKAYLIAGGLLVCSSLLAYFTWMSIIMPNQTIVRSQQLNTRETVSTATRQRIDSQLDLVAKNPFSTTVPGEAETAAAQLKPIDPLTEFHADNRYFTIQLYYEKAQKGDAESQYQLGLLHATGNGALQDFEEAIKWFALAAEKNHALAQYELGLAYQSGYGVETNLEKSYMWLNLAAAAGIEKAILARNKVMLSLNSKQLLQAQKASREWLLSIKEETVGDN